MTRKKNGTQKPPQDPKDTPTQTAKQQHINNSATQHKDGSALRRDKERLGVTAVAAAAVKSVVLLCCRLAFKIYEVLLYSNVTESKPQP